MEIINKFPLIGSKNILIGIHGLRGIAALSIVLYHIIHLVKIKAPDYFIFIGRDFGYSVHLFFILSAFSLMYSTQPTLSRTTWCREYFIKRIFRIVPLFYAILFASLLHRYMANISTNKEELLLNLTLSFGQAPWTGIAIGGWTVGVEMIFYILFPTLLLLIKSRISALVLILFLIPISIAFRSILGIHYENYINYTYNWSYFSFAPNMCFFGFGIYIFFLSKSISIDSVYAKYIIPTCALAILLVLMLGNGFTPLRAQHSRVDMILWGVGLSFLVLWQSIRPNQWIANSFLTYAGERSYSIYLLHPIIIQLMNYRTKQWYTDLYPYLGSYAFFICAIPILFVVIFTAELTYKYIEVPGIKIGQLINRKLRESN